MIVTTQYINQKICELLDNLSSTPEMTQSELDGYWTKLNRLQVLNQVEITTLNFKGKPAPQDESVTISNRGEITADLSGWRIQAGSPEQVYIFPEGTHLPAFAELVVDTAGQSEHSFRSNQPIWNNHGDTATLFDQSGETVATLVYGSKAHASTIISHLNFDGEELRSEGDEYVELSNLSEHTIVLEGWSLIATRNNVSYTFQEDTRLEPHASIRVYTNKTELQDNEYSFDCPTAIWNNAGGSCELVDYLGRLVSNYHY